MVTIESILAKIEFLAICLYIAGGVALGYMISLLNVIISKL